MKGSSAVAAWLGQGKFPAALLLLVALAGCGKGGPGGGMGFRPPPMPVETAPVVQAPVSDRFEAVGTIEASEAITVVSEIDGTVVRLPFQEGSAIARGGLIAQLDELRVTFSTPERYLGQLHRGAEVEISTTAYPGYALRGRIDVVDPVLDPGTRSARIVARVRNPGGKFRPGMSANVSAVLSQRQNALTVPSEAIFAEGDQSFVYVVKRDSTVTRSALTLGTRLPDAVEVVKGLEAGMTVVRTGHQKLFEGAKVIPVSSRPGGEGAGVAQ